MARPVKAHKIVPCFFHQDREGTTRCFTCNKSLCSECAKTYDGEVYCSPQCAENAKKFDARAEDLREMDEVYKRRELVNNFQGLIINVIIFMVICLVAFLLWKSDLIFSTAVKTNIVNNMPEWAGFLKDILKP